MVHLKKYLFLILVAVLPWPTMAAGGRAVAGPSLQEPLDSQMKIMVQRASELHQAFFNQNESQIDAALSGLVAQIDQIAQMSRILKEHDREHLLKMILAVRDLAERLKADSLLLRKNLRGVASQNSADEVRRSDAQEIFRQLAHLSRIYNVLASYHVFFCDSDKGFWLQSGRRPENPIHPDTLKNCGSMIP